MFFHRGGFGGDDSPSAGKVPDETKDARLTLSACGSSAAPQRSLADRQPKRHGATVRAVRLRARPRSCEPALARPAAPDTRPSARVPAACWPFQRFCVPALRLACPLLPGTSQSLLLPLIVVASAAAPLRHLFTPPLALLRHRAAFPFRIAESRRAGTSPQPDRYVHRRLKPSAPQPTTVSHDGGFADRPGVRVPRCTLTGLSHAVEV